MFISRKVALFEQLQAPLTALPGQVFALLHGVSSCFGLHLGAKFYLISLCFDATYRSLPSGRGGSRVGVIS